MFVKSAEGRFGEAKLPTNTALSAVAGNPLSNENGCSPY